ncbi:hypothetical protein L6452_06093 [Arctium lappa]|uniref:Uncharacterized protein n=1 Tax=Arctium lappa TaxID=4217 RepID=A0ACB9EHL9_ARCLA|nr:hypothetical protein L6452_06093 [Arctium lappa]
MEANGKEFGQVSVLMDDIQVEELQNAKAKQQLLMERCHDKFLKAKAEVEELTMKLSTLEVKWHNVTEIN